jgi:hypothetical protein
MGSEEGCFYQIYSEVLRVGGVIPLGGGDCSVCSRDPQNNRRCPGYTPIGGEMFEAFAKPTDSSAEREIHVEGIFRKMLEVQ